MSALNDRSVITLLNEKFVNCWLLGKDLARLRDAAENEELKTLYAALKKAYTYPVDSVVVSASGEVLGEISSVEVFRKRKHGYRKMLEGSLAARQ